MREWELCLLLTAQHDLWLDCIKDFRLWSVDKLPSCMIIFNKNSKPKKSFNCWSVTVIYNIQIQALLFCYLQVFLVFIRGPGYLFFYYLMTTDGVLNGYFILTNLTNFKLFTEISGTFYALFWFWSGRDLALKMLRSWISVY